MPLGSRGRFSNLLKQSKQEPESSKEEVKSSVDIGRLRKQNKEKDQIINSLKIKISDFEDERLLYLEDSSKLAKLFDMGLIDSAGEQKSFDPSNYSNETRREDLIKF